MTKCFFNLGFFECCFKWVEVYVRHMASISLQFFPRVIYLLYPSVMSFFLFPYIAQEMFCFPCICFRICQTFFTKWLLEFSFIIFEDLFSLYSLILSWYLLNIPSFAFHLFLIVVFSIFLLFSSLAFSFHSFPLYFSILINFITDYFYSNLNQIVHFDDAVR